MEILKVILSAVFSAVALFLIAKVIGHKQASQFEFFDYITGITIGSIAAEIATNLDSPWWKPTIAMFAFGAVTVLLSLITRKLPRTRKYINGTPTIILDKGKLYRENMKKSKVDLSDFMVMCRQAGYFDLNDIQTAVFEYNGKLSILPVSKKRPLSPSDVKLSPEQEQIGTEVIMDGRILDGNLKRMGYNSNWLSKKLNEQGFKKAEEVFLGICDQSGKLTLFRDR